jgi:hypothetical protein
MSENKNKDNLPDSDLFNEIRNSLREDYNSHRNSLGVRILTLFAALFTLLQTVQNSQKLSEIFPNLVIINLDFTEFGINLITLGKLTLFALICTLLLFFTFRAFFNFSLTSRYITELYWFERADFNKLPPDRKASAFNEKRWLLHLHGALGMKIAGKLDCSERLRLFGIIPYD